MATTNQDDPFPLTAPDLVDVDDLDPLAIETTSEAQNLSQDLYHSLIADADSNLDFNPDFNPLAPPGSRGVGVYSYLNGTEETFRKLPGAIIADFSKDPRVQSVTASVQQEADGSWTIPVRVEGAVGVLSLLYGYSQASGLTVINPGF